MSGAPDASVPTIRTPRLILRGWRDEDRAPFAALNADPVTMELMPHVLTREESDAFADVQDRDLRRRGWGLWAVEVPGQADFVGFIGLNPPGFDAHFTPCVEIGWRLDRAVWGQGLAPEGATAVLFYALGDLGLAEVVSFTSVGHHRSRRVMEKIGLIRDPADDFDHPRLAPGHPLRRHVLYRRAADTDLSRSR